jgi:hypothetical protein
MLRQKAMKRSVLMSLLWDVVKCLMLVWHKGNNTLLPEQKLYEALTVCVKLKAMEQTGKDNEGRHFLLSVVSRVKIMGYWN